MLLPTFIPRVAEPAKRKRARIPDLERATHRIHEFQPRGGSGARVKYTIFIYVPGVVLMNRV